MDEELKEKDEEDEAGETGEEKKVILDFLSSLFFFAYSKFSRGGMDEVLIL
jgi:hypothetical protein